MGLRALRGFSRLPLPIPLPNQFKCRDSLAAATEFRFIPLAQIVDLPQVHKPLEFFLRPLVDVEKRHAVREQLRIAIEERDQHLRANPHLRKTVGLNAQRLGAQTERRLLKDFFFNGHLAEEVVR